jgi:hypothetical protein
VVRYHRLFASDHEFAMYMHFTDLGELQALVEYIFISISGIPTARLEDSHLLHP